MYNSLQYSTVCSQVEEPPRRPRWTALHQAIVERKADDVEWWLRILPDWEVMLPSPYEDRADRAVQGSRRQQAVGMPVRLSRQFRGVGAVVLMI
jgi:hypothetical protein